MAYDIERITVEPQFAAVVGEDVAVASIGAFVGRAFGEVMAVLGRQGIAIAGMPFSRYEPLSDGVFRSEAGFPTERPIDDTDRVHGIELPGGTAIATMHSGPYDSVADAYRAMEGYLAEHGLVARLAPWESYLDGPEVAVPRTRIIWPIRDADTPER